MDLNTQFYNPPYSSPVAARFLKYISQYVDSQIKSEAEVCIKTARGDFYLNLVIETPNKYRIGIAFIDENELPGQRIDWQESIILGDGHVDVIYRLRYCDINYYMGDITYLLSQLEPDLFDVYTFKTISTLASGQMNDLNISRDIDSYFCTYFNDKGVGHSFVECKRLGSFSQKVPVWKGYYDFAAKYGVGDLDELISAYDATKN